MNTSLKIAIVVIAFLAAAALLLRSRGSTSLPERHDYYLDLTTGNLISVSATQFPPITTAGGGQAVRAYVISCQEGCPDGTRQIAYLQQYTDDAKAALGKRGETPEEDRALGARVERGQQLAANPAKGEPPKWVPAASPEGETLAQQAQQMCGGTIPWTCMP